MIEAGRVIKCSHRHELADLLIRDPWQVSRVEVISGERA